MLNLTFHVDYVDGTRKTATTAPRDEVAFERTYNTGVTAMIETRPDGGIALNALRLEHLYYLAWSALHRTGQEPRDFDSFLDVIADLDFDLDEEKDADPTPSAPPAD